MTDANVDRVRTSVGSDGTLGERLIAEMAYGTLFEGKDTNSGLRNGLSTTTMLLAQNTIRVCEFLGKKSITKLHHAFFFGSFQNLKNALRDIDLLTFLTSNAA
jgi:hypothetical protein